MINILDKAQKCPFLYVLLPERHEYWIAMIPPRVFWGFKYAEVD